MDIAALELKIKEYVARDDELAARFEAATTDAQRLEIERMRRLTQIAVLGFLSQAEKELARDHVGQGASPAVRSQATA